MIPLDYQPPGAKKVARPPTEQVTDRQAWAGMIWYLVFFAAIGIVLGLLRMRNL